MLRSMTAYGRHDVVIGEKEISVEIRSVNNRYLDLTVRLPRSHSYLEEKIKKELSARGISRGKMEVNVSIVNPLGASIAVDSAYAKEYIDALRTLRDEFGLADDISVMTVARNQEIFKIKRPDVDEEAEWNDLLSALTPAIDEFIAMREREGQNLASDMREKIALLRKYTETVSAASAEDINGYKAKLEAKLRQVLSDNRVTIDENRILTECALFADKVAVDEEIVRLDSHFGAFLEFLEASEPVGRKMDFLLQEMNRESNTIGSKCSNSEIARTVVEMKSELEKIREQIQNIE